MNLSPAYLRWRSETLQSGKQEQRQEVIENLLLARFGELDEQLSSAVRQK